MKVCHPKDIRGGDAHKRLCLVPSVHGDFKVQDSDSHVDLLHIPSLGIGQFMKEINENVPGVLFYEERMLCLLLHLNNPKNRLIYVTSMPVSPTVIDYYLHLLTDVSMEDAKRRLSMVCCYDVTVQPLALKLLKRPRLMERLKKQICPSKTIISTYTHTEAEQEIALRLGIHHAISPICSFWGTKSGSRIAFRETNIPHCFGTHESVNTVDALVQQVVELLQQNPNLDTLMVKLNEGVSGYGNAKWTLPRGTTDPQVLKESLLTDLEPVSNQGPREFLDRMSNLGAIVEEFLTIPGMRSPSVQGRVHPDGSVEVVSTHEQVLHNGVYDGCTFPAKEDYRLELQKYCAAVGEFLSSKGIRDESYGVDFVAWQDQDETSPGKSDTVHESNWHLSAIEINLRSLGTTHPMMTLKLVTVGGKQTPTGEFVNRQGQARCYFAVDSFQHKSLSSLTPDDLFDLVQAHPILQYHKDTSTGTIFYMLDSLPSFGKVGIMCIQDTTANSLKRFEQVKQCLLMECACEPSLQSNGFSSSGLVH